jgi:peptide/nickel transport system permease protein
MLAYSIRRTLLAIPILLFASVIVFTLTLFTGDPVEEKYAGRNPPVPQQTIDNERERLNLDEPVLVQYRDWLTGLVLHGDFGPSLNGTDDIGEELAKRTFVTLRLVLFAMFLALILAVVSGVLSAVKQYSRADHIFTFVGFVFLAMPPFWTAVLLKQAALHVNEAAGHRMFFTIGARSDETAPGWFNTVSDTFGHLALPTISLALITYAAWSRFQRSSMLEVLNSDYIRLARSKGLTPRRVLIRHALRTALIPMTTVSALAIAATIGGAVITETVFEWQGLGRYLINSITTRDRYAILGLLLLTGFIVVVGNLIADILYGVLDPRIRYE